MTITIRYWSDNYYYDYTEKICGDSAADCMAQIKAKRENHDLAKYTPIEIINVED